MTSPNPAQMDDYALGFETGKLARRFDPASIPAELAETADLEVTPAYARGYLVGLAVA